MYFIIDIHWKRHTPQDGTASSGRATYAEFAKTLTSAKARAARKFNRHYGIHLTIESVEQKQDPSGIFTPSH